MVVCQYFLKGDCRFGDRCHYEHPTAKKKTTCPHFLKGYCRFGDKCWNDHPRGGGGGGGFGNQASFGGSNFGGYRQGNNKGGGGGGWGSSYTSQNRFEALSGGQKETFGGQQGKATESGQTGSQIQQILSKDLEMWEQGKQWPLSCYTYTKEEPCLAGLSDVSPEELRYEAYKANGEGKAEAFQQMLTGLLTSNKQRKLQLSRMSASEIKEEVKSQSTAAPIIAGSTFQVSSQQNTGTGLFSSSTSASQSGGLFGGGSTTNQSNAFLGTGNSTNQSGGLFGAGSTTSQSGVPFGASSATNQSSGFLGTGSFVNQSGGLLGSNTSTSMTGSPLGSNNSTNQATGMFGIPNNSMATNQPAGLGFGGSGNTGQIGGSTMMASGTLFGASSPTAQSKGLFGNETQQTTGLFGSALPATTGGLFGSSTTQPTNSGSVFGGQAGQNVLGNLAQTPLPGTQSTTAGKSQVASSKGGALTCSEQDMQAFMTDSFVLGQIPECPPPPELC